MHTVDPRLNDIDDCLYRVAVRAIITDNGKVLLVKELTNEWWAFPGGGVDHGETVESSLIRELEEELGVSAQEVTSDFKIAHYTIGDIVNTIPRMNLYFKVSLAKKSFKKTTHVAEWRWFTKDEFLKTTINSSYNKAALTGIIFGG